MPAPTATIEFLIWNRAQVSVECNVCANLRHPYLMSLAARYGKKTEIGKVKFRCAMCGSRDVDIKIDAGQHGPVTLPPEE